MGARRRRPEPRASPRITGFPYAQVLGKPSSLGCIRAYFKSLRKDLVQPLLSNKRKKQKSQCGASGGELAAGSETPAGTCCHPSQDEGAGAGAAPGIGGSALIQGAVSSQPPIEHLLCAWHCGRHGGYRWGLRQTGTCSVDVTVTGTGGSASIGW